MIGEGRSYGLDIIRPSSTIMFKSFRTVIKTLPFIQTEKYSFVDFVIDENNVILPGSHHRSDIFDITSVNYLVDERRPINKCEEDRKSTRLNSSHTVISYAVFCLKKKKKEKRTKKKKHKE